jgi:hypothetical protein
MLIRLYRCFDTWVAPGLALGVFVIGYLVSSLYIGPLITGVNPTRADVSAVTTTTHGHDH